MSAQAVAANAAPGKLTRDRERVETVLVDGVTVSDRLRGLDQKTGANTCNVAPAPVRPAQHDYQPGTSAANGHASAHIAL